jgi:hypothetical protein
MIDVISYISDYLDNDKDILNIISLNADTRTLCNDKNFWIKKYDNLGLPWTNLHYGKTYIKDFVNINKKFDDVLKIFNYKSSSTVSILIYNRISTLLFLQMLNRSHINLGYKLYCDDITNLCINNKKRITFPINGTMCETLVSSWQIKILLYHLYKI